MAMNDFMNRFQGGSRHVPAHRPATITNGTLTTADEMQLALKAAAKAPAQGMAGFINQFNKLGDPIYFYHVDGKPTVTLVFDVQEHVYYRRYEDGKLEEQNGVTSVVHIIDKSNMLTPWAAKMVAEKAIRLMPTEQGELGELVTKRMSLQEFTTLMMEAKTAPKDRLEEAGNIGHIAHACLEDSIKRAIALDDGVVVDLVNPPTDERARNCADAGLKWMRAHNVRWLATEQKIYSLKYKYAGTLDGRCLVDSCTDPLCCRTPFKDALTVADWKSSNQLNIEYLYQTAAYEHAYEEEHGVDITDRWILRLGKQDGEFEPWHLTAEDFADDFAGFLRCLELGNAHERVKDRMSTAKKARTAARRAANLAAKELAKEQERLAKALAKAEKKRLALEKKAADKAAKKTAADLKRAEKKAAKDAEKAQKKAQRVADRAAKKAAPQQEQQAA
jgi:hypothetical protein